MSETGKISDGYHTFDELYEHRNLLMIALMKHNTLISWRAKTHEDGTMFHGWFIAGMHLPTGDISYHLPIDMWEMLDTPYYLILEGKNIETRENAPKWDGHTPKDVLERLKLWIK